MIWCSQNTNIILRSYVCYFIKTSAAIVGKKKWNVGLGCRVRALEEPSVGTRRPLFAWIKFLFRRKHKAHRSTTVLDTVHLLGSEKRKNVRNAFRHPPQRTRETDASEQHTRVAANYRATCWPCAVNVAPATPFLYRNWIFSIFCFLDELFGCCDAGAWSWWPDRWKDPVPRSERCHSLSTD